MPLTQDQIALIQTSHARLIERRGRNGPFGDLFYQELFRRLPEARKLFRDDLEEQGMRFLSTLGVIVASLDRDDLREGYLSRLAEGHAAYGVKPEQYGPMWEALAEALKAALEDRFDAETEAAWHAAYDLIAARMQA